MLKYENEPEIRVPALAPEAALSSDDLTAHSPNGEFKE